LQIAILQLFVRTDCLLPNMFVGTLTAKSVTTAISRGISAEMLVKYLEDHRHPKVSHRAPVVPDAVTDQLLLWQAEMNRLETSPAVLYDAFETPALFEGTVAKAKKLSAVLFVDEKLRRLVAHSRVHGALRGHIQALRQQTIAG
jgi:transcription initiation factor TFIIH subunit 4